MRTDDATRTCVHCVLARAIVYVARRHGVTFSMRGSFEPSLVPIRAGALYRSIRAVLTPDVDASPARPAFTEIRILGGTHPFVDVYVMETVRDLMSTRILSIARHREGTLEGGFLEGEPSGDIWMRRATPSTAT